MTDRRYHPWPPKATVMPQLSDNSMGSKTRLGWGSVKPSVWSGADGQLNYMDWETRESTSTRSEVLPVGTTVVASRDLTGGSGAQTCVISRLGGC